MFVAHKIRYSGAMNRSRIALLLLSAGIVVGCASRFDKLTRTRAATDWNCAEENVALDKQDSSVVGAKYNVSGCDRSDVYYVDCSIFGVCKTLSSAELAARNDAYRQQQAARAAAAPPPSTSAAAPSSSSSSSSSSPSLPKNCGFDSDCGAGVKCNSGRCANTEGSKCGFDSDCGGNGAKCNSGKCSNAPDGRCAFNSECPGGSCSSGKCRF